jgi:fructose transport system substrate-binding protein
VVRYTVTGRSRRRRVGTAAVVTAVLSLLLAACGLNNQGTGVSLILKTQTNPYFVAMKQAAEREAAKKGVHLSVAAGTQDGDTQNQINEVYTAIARGDKGILITSNGNAINASLRQARKAGLYVIALDTPLIPADTAQNTYATDNRQAGRLIGQYAAAALKGKPAVIAMLDLYNDQVVTVDINRDHGFLEGMGIPIGNPSQNGLEPKTGHYSGGKGGSYKIVCHRPTQGAIDGGRQAMEQCLSANPDINVIYTINEPAGEGAYAAMTAAHKQNQATLVTIDGSCAGIELVRKNIFDADAVQYPGKMAEIGVSAIDTVAHGGKPPTKTPGKDFLDTGTALATNQPLPGIKSQTPDQAAKKCWGEP